MKSYISNQIRLRGTLKYGRGCIVDDYCYISTRLVLGEFVHVGHGCTFGGGCDYSVRVGDMSSISCGCRLFVRSNDYVNDLVVCLPKDTVIGDRMIEGDITFRGFNGVGANTVIMPDVEFRAGAIVGANSFVPAHNCLESWGVYAGNPIQFIRLRNIKNVLKQVGYLEKHKNVL